MSLHFANNVFLLHFTLEATESAFERLVIAKLDFCHSVITCLSITAKDIRLEMLMGLGYDAVKGLSAIKRSTRINFHQWWLQVAGGLLSSFFIQV